MTTGSDQPDPAAAHQASRPHRRWYRLALVVTIVLVVFVVIALPIAVGSMVEEIFGRQKDTRYDFLTGAEVVTAAAAPTDATYLNIDVIDLDEGTGLATLGLSGHRDCADVCPAISVVLLSLNDDAALRRGLSPSATLELAPGDLVFTETRQLPVDGNPGRYPFDDYRLWLGVAGFVTQADGTTVPVTADVLPSQASLTLQAELTGFQMSPPVPIDPERVRAPEDLFAPLVVQGVTFERPVYLKVLSVLLVVLIAISGALTLLTRTFGDLLLGVGGLILGVWGVRSVMVPQPMPTVSAVDLALSGVILFLLLGLAIRAARHFHDLSELPVPRPHRRR